jgi:hypothetical protein
MRLFSVHQQGLTRSTCRPHADVPVVDEEITLSRTRPRIVTVSYFGALGRMRRFVRWNLQGSLTT